MLSPTEMTAASLVHADRDLSHVPAADTLTPADRYHELFVDVQLNRIFEDGKTFVDCSPRFDPTAILDAYRLRKQQPGFDLLAFVLEHFELPQAVDGEYRSDPSRSLCEHIDHLWDVLTRLPEQHPRRSSLLPLPHPYVVPGGRFAELYYWDSYFTMIGLAASGRLDLIKSMADNFAWLIDTYGHVPNANRTYYLSRSHPPMFVFMVDLFHQYGIGRAEDYLPQLRKEHAYWMEGADEIRAGEQHRHVVRTLDGRLLNRYWDDRDTPREESYREDVTTARGSDRSSHVVYRDLRAAAASGWDFSSRWCVDDGGLCTTRTTAILPVDLNSFMFRLEQSIAELSAQVGDQAAAQSFAEQAARRREAIHRLMWNEQAGAFFDYDWDQEAQREVLTAATVAPLFAGLASLPQADRLAGTVRARLLSAGGFSTTEHESGEQWDRPNGWAPLQWLAVAGFRRYRHDELAGDIAQRWIDTVAGVYKTQYKLVEKYRLRGECRGVPGGGRGGEYPLQDGFGWTNGVTRRLLKDYPQQADVHPQA